MQNGYCYYVMLALLGATKLYDLKFFNWRAMYEFQNKVYAE